MLVKEMHGKCAFAQAWSEEIAAPLVTTEAWGAVVAHGPSRPGLGLAARLVRAVHDPGGRHKFWGVTPWNYSHPYWKNWSDVKWYRKVNRRFLRS